MSEGKMKTGIRSERLYYCKDINGLGCDFYNPDTANHEDKKCLSVDTDSGIKGLGICFHHKAIDTHNKNKR